MFLTLGKKGCMDGKSSDKWPQATCCSRSLDVQFSYLIISLLSFTRFCLDASFILDKSLLPPKYF